MGYRRLLVGNVATVAVTVLAFLQLLPWPVAGLLILASVVIASLPHRNGSRSQMSLPQSPTASKPMKTVRQRLPERPSVRIEKQAVEQKIEPKPAKPRQPSVKTVSAKETPVREKGRDAPVAIREGDYLSFDVELESGEEVLGEVSASGDVNVYVLTDENLTNLDLGQEFWYDAGNEGVQKATLRFTAEEEGKWFFVVENADTKDVSATVKISVNKASHSIPFLKTESLGLPGEKLEGKL